MCDFEYTQKLIDHGASAMDQELFDQVTPLSLQSHGEESLDKIPTFNQERSTGEDSFSEMESEENSSSEGATRKQEETPVEQHDQSSSSMPKKRKAIHKIPYADIFDSSDESEHRPRRRPKDRRKRGQANGYPTKNFLPNFKGPHIQFLEKELGFYLVNSFPIVRTIKEKNGISMHDYQTLYRVPEFQEAFEKFFKTKYLYRELMLSRSSLKARKVHNKKLHVFEDAFYSKEFTKIN